MDRISGFGPVDGGSIPPVPISLKTENFLNFYDRSKKKIYN